MYTHVAAVDKVSELPEPKEGQQALVKGERAVYITKKVGDGFQWELAAKLK